MAGHSASWVLGIYLREALLGRRGLTALKRRKFGITMLVVRL